MVNIVNSILYTFQRTAITKENLDRFSILFVDIDRLFIFYLKYLGRPATADRVPGEPLLEPLDHPCAGFVPNVVYSCGSLIHNGWLVLSYAISDYGDDRT